MDAIVFDGAVLVQMLSPGTADTFEEYINDVFAPYILRQVGNILNIFRKIVTSQHIC